MAHQVAVDFVWAKLQAAFLEGPEDAAAVASFEALAAAASHRPHQGGNADVLRR